MRSLAIPSRIINHGLIPSTISVATTKPNQRCYFHSTPSPQFINQIFSSLSSSVDAPPRVLTAQRILPYPLPRCFRLVASIDEYPSFLPFIHSSKVLERDAKGWPSRATLDVGYAGFNEVFTSRVDCDKEGRSVRARSGEDGDGEGVFRVLDTLWHFKEVGEDGKDGTEAKLSVKVKFRNPGYDALLSAVEGQVAGSMIRAFERRLKETEGQ